MSKRSILLPTDFSPASANAYRYACSLAESLNARLDVLHIYNLSMTEVSQAPYEYIDQMASDKKAAAQKELSQVLASTSAPGVEIHPQVTYGVFTATEILDHAKSSPYTLIVMGMQGEHNMVEQIMGSVTTEVMLHAACPVLAVPAGAAFKPVEHIAYATDYEPGEQQAVDQLSELAKDLNAGLHCVHVISGQATEPVESEVVVVENHPFKLKEICIVRHHSISEGLASYIADNHIDLLALYVPQRRLLERLFHSSFSKKMAFHAKVPLLVFHS